MRINNQNNQNFKSLSPLSSPLGQFYNANATIPTLIIETGVTLGRAHQANKRGGAPEAIDRLVEQGISAVVWIYGVNILKNIGNFIGKKALKIKDLNFDIGFDELRNPTKYIDKKALGFKAANILTSTAIATYFIGAILPKINNAILKKTLKKEENKKQIEQKITVPSFNEFQKNTKKNKEISFTSLLDTTINAAHVLENNSAARLFVTDTGVIAGRYYNAPNKYRKIEGLFRDIASIYFYLCSTAHVVAGLNGLSKNTNINPKALEKTVEMLCDNVQANPDDFKNSILGEIDKTELSKLDELFKGKKVLSVDEFSEAFSKYAQKAKEMAKLQYIESGNGVLSYQQARDVLSTSKTSNPEFLKDVFKKATGKEIDDKLCFVSSKKLNEIRTSIDKFVEQVRRSAIDDKCEISADYIKKVAKNNIAKNFAFNVIGTAISIYALGFLIPKIQYAITKKLTNEDKFHTEEE
ncbi:MAG: hypothetical protein IJW73_07535 [Candidatus Gastranaerophilales bacterium]|nr:hypothetical protein [Candidatus Gastranaerophilales bacterium]